MTGSKIYDQKFYKIIKDGCLKSAEAVVPRLRSLIPPNDCDDCPPPLIVDAGCGEGWWLSVFAAYGDRVRGFDGDYVDLSRLAIPSESFTPTDLSRVSTEFPPADLLITLEVAEHLPEARADSFVADLCRLQNGIVFSAAIPRQGGAGHVNERWPDYWVERFEANGFVCSGALRWEFWDDDRVENWYRQNLMVCAREGSAFHLHNEQLFDSPLAPMFPVIHPVLWNART